MKVTNLYSNKEFECHSFERPEDNSKIFHIKFDRDTTRFKKDWDQPNKQYYTIVHDIDEFECSGKHVKIYITEFFYVTDSFQITSATESYFNKRGDTVFVCEELDNFGKIKMICDLRKLDPTRDWRKVLHEKKTEYLN